MRTITKVVVHKLLGEFNHEVRFPSEHEFVVLHGPNGVGKTRLLELITATFRMNLRKLQSIPFEVLSFDFSDRSKLTLRKGDAESNSNWPTGEWNPPFLVDIEFELTVDNGVQVWKPDIPDLKDLPPALRRDVQRMADRLLAQRSVESFDEAIRDSWLHFSPSLPRYRGSRTWIYDIPKWLEDFLGSITVHLIETQRLVTYKEDDADRARQKSDTVHEFSQHLKHLISNVLAQNSRTTQQLDRSFPKRVLTAPLLGPDVTDERIRERYAEQSRLREALEDISVLDNQEDLPLPDDELKDWQLRVLWVYLNDTDDKLATFQWILDRIRLLQQIVNSKFLNKLLKVEREAGFLFETPTGRTLDPSQLSSGEQHELVLLYDLLFNVKQGSLVLIDEPEISLNVVWQRKFLSDMQSIASLADLRFIVATHSPQIIHKWRSRVSPLGPQEISEDA